MISSIYPYTWYNPTKSELVGVKALIAFDMDSVLNETGELLREAVAREFGKEVEDIIKYGDGGYEMFNFDMPHGFNSIDIFSSVNRIIWRDSFHYPQSPNMKATIKWLYSRTYRPITVVTARSIQNMDVTYKWLKRNLWPVPFRLIMVQGMQKHVVLNRIGNVMYVDDRYKTVKTLEKHITLPILYKRPWNQGRPEPAGFAEINNLAELIPLIIKMGDLLYD